MAIFAMALSAIGSALRANLLTDQLTRPTARRMCCPVRTRRSTSTRSARTFHPKPNPNPNPNSNPNPNPNPNPCPNPCPNPDLDQVRKDIRDFKAANKLDKVTVLSTLTPSPNPNPDLNPNPNPNQVTGKMSERNVEKQQRQAAACFAGWKLGK